MLLDHHLLSGALWLSVSTLFCWYTISLFETLREKPRVIHNPATVYSLIMDTQSKRTPLCKGLLLLSTASTLYLVSR